jgi:hypothetical protein
MRWWQIRCANRDCQPLKIDAARASIVVVVNISGFMSEIPLALRFMHRTVLTRQSSFYLNGVRVCRASVFAQGRGNMNKLFRIVAVLILSAFGGFSLSAFAADIFSKKEREIFDKTMSAARNNDPATYAVLLDHIEETEAIFRELFDTGDAAAARQKVLDLAGKYAMPTLARASDETTVALYAPVRTVIEVLKIHKPEGCKQYLYGQFNINFLDNPVLTAANKYFSDTILETYSSGKKNTQTGTLLTEDQLADIMVENLGISEEELEKLEDLSAISDADACRLAAKFYDHQRIPEVHRAAFLRTLVFAQ